MNVNNFGLANERVKMKLIKRTDKGLIRVPNDVARVFYIWEFFIDKKANFFVDFLNIDRDDFPIGIFFKTLVLFDKVFNYNFFILSSSCGYKRNDNEYG
ncbi:MAG TPA: hypothetical protein DIT52_06635 [Flavobacteriaceae bacterium]|nr:hypothetical protein [Flavobacteriaceae bacterium]